MKGTGLWLRFLCLQLAISFASSQQQTPSPSVIVQLVTATENLYSDDVATTTFTDSTGSSYTLTYENPAFTTTSTTTDPTASGDGTQENYRLQYHDVSIAVGYEIQLGGVETFPTCYFPTSGTWSLLPRIAFYVSLIFALIARKHVWLIGGALAAALTYSSLAAIQVSLQVWTHRARAELDIFPIIGLLAVACIIAVPLMNWSSTIQRLGLEEQEERPEETQSSFQSQNMYTSGNRQSTSPNTQDNRQSKNVDEVYTKKPYAKNKDYGPTRIVLVFWNLIVAVGLFSAYIGLTEFVDGASWISLYDPEFQITSISCIPPDGNLNMTAGQYPEWQSFWPTSEFVEQNHCSNPCREESNFPGTLFRSPDEMQLFSAGSVDHIYEQTHISLKAHRNITFVEESLAPLVLVLSFIVLQGIFQMLVFWRSTPAKARWQIYHHLEDGPFGKGFALWVAWLFYGISMLILLISPAIFVLTITIAELIIAWIPQTETNAHVDQWGVFAVTILVLLTSIICRIAPGLRDDIKIEKLEKKIEGYSNILECKNEVQQSPPKFPCMVIPRLKIFCRHVGKFPLENLNPLEFFKDHKARSFRLIKYEWQQAKDFYREPSKKPKRIEKNTDVQWKLEEKESDKKKRRAAEERAETIERLRKKVKGLKSDVEKAKGEVKSKTSSSHQSPSCLEQGFANIGHPMSTNPMSAIQSGTTMPASNSIPLARPSHRQGPRESSQPHPRYQRRRDEPYHDITPTIISPQQTTQDTTNSYFDSRSPTLAGISPPFDSPGGFSIARKPHAGSQALSPGHQNQTPGYLSPASTLYHPHTPASPAPSSYRRTESSELAALLPIHSPSNSNSRSPSPGAGLGADSGSGSRSRSRSSSGHQRYMPRISPYQEPQNGVYSNEPSPSGFDGYQEYPLQQYEHEATDTDETRLIGGGTTARSMGIRGSGSWNIGGR